MSLSLGKEGILKIRVVRIITYEGDINWVIKQREKAIHGTKRIDSPEFGTCYIHAHTIGEAPLPTKTLEKLDKERRES